jgi:hypothetical protein
MELAEREIKGRGTKAGGKAGDVSADILASSARERE